jgi:hypothetical protein
VTDFTIFFSVVDMVNTPFESLSLSLFCFAWFDDNVGWLALDNRENVPRLIHEGHRVLIFSQWTKLLDVLELLMHHLAVDFLRLDGSTPVTDGLAYF